LLFRIGINLNFGALSSATDAGTLVLVHLLKD